MRIRRTATLALTATTAALASVIGVGATAAFAQTADYPGGKTDQQVEASNADRNEVEGVVVARSGDASPTADGLALTGGDVAGLGALGAGLVVGGTVLVRRSRRRTATA
jgi:hypothetical protein